MWSLLKSGVTLLLRYLTAPLPGDPATPRWLRLARLSCRLLQARRPPPAP